MYNYLLCQSLLQYVIKFNTIIITLTKYVDKYADNYNLNITSD